MMLRHLLRPDLCMSCCFARSATLTDCLTDCQEPYHLNGAISTLVHSIWAGML